MSRFIGVDALRAYMITNYEGRLKELEAMGIAEDILKSEQCLDCKNVKSLPSCPKSCDGIMAEKKGYDRDKTIFDLE